MRLAGFFLTLTLLCGSAFGYTTPNTNVVWTLADFVANSAGAVTGSGTNFAIHTNVWISAKDTLNIAPGTTVLTGEMPDFAYLIVQGTVIAAGTQIQPIRFTSSASRATNTTQFDRCLEIQNPSSTQTVLNWVTFENCDIGFATFTTNSLSISNCTFQLCNQGADVQGQNTTFSSCTFQNNGFASYPREGAGAYCWRGSPIFLNCNFANNTTGTNAGNWFGGGLCMYSVSNALVQTCMFTNNRAQFGAGLAVSDCTNLTVRSCAFSANQIINYALSNNGDDAQIESSQNVVVERCPSLERIFYWQSSGRLVNNIFNSYWHDTGGFNGYGTFGCTDCSPLVAHNVMRYIYCFGSSSPVVANNVFSGDLESGYIQELSTNADPVVLNNRFVSTAILYKDENSTLLTNVTQINALPGNSGNTQGSDIGLDTAKLVLTGNSPLFDAAFDGSNQ